MNPTDGICKALGIYACSELVEVGVEYGLADKIVGSLGGYCACGRNSESERYYRHQNSKSKTERKDFYR